MIGVTDIGLEFLKRSNVISKINENWKEIEKTIPMTVMYEDDLEELSENLTGERKRAVERLKHENKANYSDDYFLICGEATDILFSKDEQKELMRKFKISQLELDGVIAAYCLMKDFETRHKAYSWFSEEHKLKTHIYGDIHGDVCIIQLNLHPVLKQKRIDGTYPLFGELPENSTRLDYGEWLTLAIIPLKYSVQTGIEFEEIKNWRELLNVEPKKSNYEDYNFFEIQFKKCNIVSENHSSEGYPFGLMCSTDAYFMPVIDSQNHLWIYSTYQTKGKKISLNNTDYYPLIKIPKEDVPNLFKGVIHAVKNHQTRTLPSSLAYLLEMLS